MCGKGSNTTTQTSAPNASAMQAYQELLARGQQAASTPYQGYGGELVAGINQQQQTGIGGINAGANFAQPYIGEAAGYARQGASPISGEDISRYLNPYTQDVVNATQAQFNNANAQQQQQVVGNAAMQGALGGDRVGVAQAELAGQQSRAQNPVIAGLYSQGFNTALSAAQQQQQAASNAAYSLGNLGISGQGAALQGAGAQIGAGSLQQGTQQAQDTAAYNQFLQQLAFPYQQTGWLAGLTSGIGSQMGGTQTTTAPPPNPWSTIAGLGLSGVGLVGGTGGFGSNGWVRGMFSKDGGRIPHRAEGGGIATMPYGDAPSFIPGLQIVHGPGAPHGGLGPAQNQGSSTVSQMANTAIELSKALKGGMSPSGPTSIAPQGISVPSTPMGGINPGGIATAPSSSDAIYADGGAVMDMAPGPGGIYAPRGYADGGDPSFDDRWGPVMAGIATGELDPAGANGLPSVNTPLPRARPVDADDGAPLVRTAGIGAPPVGAGAPLPPALTFAGDEQTELNPSGGIAAGPRPGSSSPSASPWMPLVAAGLGMMASRSPFLGTAIGEGGLAGLNTYSQQQKLAQEQANKEAERGLQTRRVDLEAKRLTQQADQFAKQLAETTRQHDISQNKPVAVGSTLVNPKTGEPIFTATDSLLDPETLKFMAQQYRAGDTSVLTNLGRGAQGAQNIVRLRKEIQRQNEFEGLGGADQAVRNAEYFGTKAGQRTLGTKQANIELAATEFNQVLPVVQKASQAVNRTNYPDLNKIVQAFEQKTGDPNIVAFGGGVNTLVNLYARAISPSGVPTVNDKEHAREILSKAWSQGQFDAAVGMMKQEIDAALTSPEKVRDEMRKRFISGQGAPSHAPETTAPAAAAPVRVTTPAEASKLKPGTRYITPDGKEYVR